jgi:thioester reductase-like protein
MSGGRFNYSQYRIEEIAEEIDTIIHNESDQFSHKTLRELKAAVSVLRLAYVYAQRVDWFISGDDGEDTFHERLKKDLERLNGNC